MSDIWIVTITIAAVVGLFLWDRFPVIIVCVGCALSLWATESDAATKPCGLR